jgi:hypothetical protein
MSGASLFARYAFPPNELGYCGPDGAEVLLQHGGAGGRESEVARRARLFDGAWPYLEIIAAAAGLDDPLHEQVVEAYWIGNDLLRLVDPAACAAQLRRRFRGQRTSRLGSAGSALPHHSFHVFGVYPWVGMLGSGHDGVALSVLQQCRIRWGTVVGVEGERVRVLSEPLRLVDGTLALGPPREESVRWSADGSSLVAGLAEGDAVSLHWDWVCDILDAGQLAALQHWSALELREVDDLTSA